jgi:hypothetical protein
MTTRFSLAIAGLCSVATVACTSLPTTPRDMVLDRDAGALDVQQANDSSDDSSDAQDAVKNAVFDGAPSASDAVVDLGAGVGAVDSPQSQPDQGSPADLGVAADARETGTDVLGALKDALVDLTVDAGVVDAPQLCTPETDAQMCTRLVRVCGSAPAPDNCGTTRTPNCGPASRLCSQDGLLGTCGAGTETCNAQGRWGSCSIQPAASGLDTCAPGNDDNCNGIANQGCLCIEGASRTCGLCNDGAQVCSNGKLGTYGACTGGTQQAVYYRDMDGDGYGSTTTILACGGAPTGYVALGGDCCDTDATVHPGVPATTWFVSASKCGTFDYDCDGTATREFPSVAAGCALTGVFGCSDSGWTTVVPACGSLGDWSNCQQVSTSIGTVLRISCVLTATTQTQACR